MAQRARELAHDVLDDVMSARLLEIAAEWRRRLMPRSGRTRHDQPFTTPPQIIERDQPAMSPKHRAFR